MTCGRTWRRAEHYLIVCSSFLPGHQAPAAMRLPFPGETVMRSIDQNGKKDVSVKLMQSTEEDLLDLGTARLNWG